MTHEDNFLENLCSGDAGAADQAFRTYEHYLRMMVRRWLSPQVRPKFDSVDIVQSVWADLLQGFREGRWHFDDAAHLRAFLVKVTHNRFLNRIRKNRSALQHERPFGGTGPDDALPSHEPAPDDIAQAEELWEELLELASPTHRIVLQLKQRGLALPEIAAETGLHESSIRRILYDLARRIACRHQTERAPANADIGG